MHDNNDMISKHRLVNNNILLYRRRFVRHDPGAHKLSYRARGNNRDRATSITGFRSVRVNRGLVVSPNRGGTPCIYYILYFAFQQIMYYSIILSY